MGGMTIAMVGAHSGNMEVLTAALENGVRPDIKDHKGKTALDYAKAANHSEIVSYLESLAAAKPASSKKTAA